MQRIDDRAGADSNDKKIVAASHSTADADGRADGW
jgi:hypothetical protein